MKFWWQKAKANFEYNPKTFMWDVTIADQDESSPFAAGKMGNSKHWLLPMAYAKATWEYYTDDEAS